MTRGQRRARSTAGIAAACSLLTLAVCAQAKAFRLPVNFNQSAAIGGSDHRFFTGSPSDRYTCKVCHTGGQSPQVTIAGLPITGYNPGQTYPIVLDWDDALASVALNIEMTDAAGHALGSFSVPAPEELTPADLCSGTPALVVTAAPERTLALMTECGAHQTTFRWTAPAATTDPSGRPVAPVAWFSGSLIASDKDGSIEGDGVVDLSYVFGATGAAAPATTDITGSCAVARPVSNGSWGLLSVLAAMGWFCWRRKASS